jgi:hypothetical protein
LSGGIAPDGGQADAANQRITAALAPPDQQQS